MGSMGSHREGHSIRHPCRASSTPTTPENGGLKLARLSRSHRRLLERHIQRFSQVRILVVGDIILDHYIWGRVSRISPEAPVPVVHVHHESLQLGGAANVFNNISTLGGQADICGVIGSDEGGRQLLKALGAQRQERGGVVIDQERPTTKKTRVIAHNQQVVRFDVERRRDITATVQCRIFRYVESQLREISCLVVSDYAKGVITESLMAELARLAALRHIPIVVDPKIEHFSYYKGVTVVTPNHMEALHAAGIHADDDQAIQEAGEIIRQRLGCQSVLVTRGEKGMSLFEPNGTNWQIPAVAQQVYDVTGAGDTVVGTLALALAAGASMRDASILANHAAGVVVGLVGTATVSSDQLIAALAHA